MVMCSYQSIREWQTRLVLIKPNANSSASLELSLVVVDLVDLNTGAVINHDKIVAYDALSYAWGTAAPSIECICDGNAILLRDNLDSALKHLRRPEKERYIWIDFLCINQDDLAEKAVQIPRMKNIYSKASTVVAWLGKSLEIEHITRLCEKNCGPNLDLLDCLIHGKQLGKPIMDYAWFQRTWVRQEVCAAERLEVSCPYFSTTWELLINKLLHVYTQNLGRPSFAFNPKAVNNLKSLDQLYSSRALELLTLLKQGEGFQASVPHDHVFSVLGMMTTPKHSTKVSIPVTYGKTYREVCGDVTRYIIRESRSISILQLCTVQRDRTYAFDWPTVKWSCSIPDLMGRYDRCDLTGEYIEEFEKENPMRTSGTTDQSENTGSFSVPTRLVSERPLTLYGRAWGTVNHRIGEKFLAAYWLDEGTSLSQEVIDTQHAASHYQPPQLSKISMRIFTRPEKPGGRISVDHMPEDPDEYRNFTLSTSSLMGTISEGKPNGYDSKVHWKCRGCIAKGDVFVALEPGPRNVLLRRCSGLSGNFEVVGWGDEMKTTRVSIFGGRRDSGFKLRENLALRPRLRFKIR